MIHLQPRLVLASTSPYRLELLAKTGLPFEAARPLCDENTAKKKLSDQRKTPLEVAEALSKLKVQSLIDHPDYQNATVIGGDQLVHFEGEVYGKPHTAEQAVQQLEKLQGAVHELITAVTIQTLDKVYHLNHITTLSMRKLTPQEIKGYVKKDQPLDCAGSYKIEKSGVCLFEKIQTDDFTAIQGLPLIWLTQKLKECGYVLFQK